MNGASRRFEQIMFNIEMQDEYLKRFGFEPNRIILGSSVYDILSRDFRGMIYHYADCFTKGSKATVMGMPVTVDYENKWLIEVCHGFEWDGRDILYPDKKGSQEV